LSQSGRHSGAGDKEAIMFGKKLAVTIITFVAMAISGVALAAGTVQTDRSEPGWQKALAIRGEALNRKYHLGNSQQRTAADATPDWAQALATRSEALNRKYHLGARGGK
jgi:hypothetical protein